MTPGRGHRRIRQRRCFALVILRRTTSPDHLHNTPLATAPTVRDLVQLPYSEQVVKEAMRLYLSAPGVTRQPICDLILGGYPIRKGSTIAISTYVMHYGPTLFPDPERFDLDR